MLLQEKTFKGDHDIIDVTMATVQLCEKTPPPPKKKKKFGNYLGT